MRHLDPVSIQTFMDALPVPVFLKDGQERYVGCNRVFETTLGTDRRQIVGKKAEDITAPDLAQIYHEKDQELLKDPGTQVYEASLLYADGTLHEVVFNKAAYLDDAGALGGIIGVILDITERKRAEARLEETLEMVRKMVAAAPAGIAVYEADSGQCILCNPAMAALAGGGIAEIERLNFRQLASWRDSGLLEAAERTLATGEDQRLEAHLTSSFGRSAWVSCVFTAFSSAHHKHLLMLANDITSRKAAEEARIRSEIQYRTLTEKMGEGLISTDQAGVITYCNPKFLRMLGYRAEEVLGRTFFEMAHGYSYRRFLDRLRNRSRGQSEQYELQLHHKGGYGVDVLVSAEPLFDSLGEFTGTLGIITDIRERKLQEETLRRAQKVESLMTLAGGIAHDFNN
ncbi:MAG TPA: PAS domain S-box protein, partial [Holophaga sp.]|nr:PAS domain S-box protein [Holophaga sp.]